MGLPGYIKRSGYLQGMFILIVLVSGIMGWAWLMGVTVDRIDVHGTSNAVEHEIRDLAGVDTGYVMFQISTRVVADRVSRHPWVSRANVTRLPTGSLAIRVSERNPVVQIVTGDGRPGFYLDADGYQMPWTSTSFYDVPLLHGYPEKYHPVVPTTDVRILEFLKAMTLEHDRAGPLISEIIVQPDDMWLRLEPTAWNGSTPVRLGRDDYQNKLDRLIEFWDQRVAKRQDRELELIDLRFSSQIIAREVVHTRLDQIVD